MLQPIYGMAAIVGACISASVVLKRIYRKFPVPAEVERKVLHLIFGICLFWLVALLVSIIIFNPILLKIVPAANKLFSGTKKVERKSIGGSLFGIAFLLLFVLAQHHRLYYLISGLVIVFADTAAALVGKRYPWLKYEVWGMQKTLSGSLAFFVTALLCIYLPLLLIGHYQFLNIWVFGLMAAYTVTLIEAISPFGLDNLSIPLSVFFLLELFLW